MVISKQERLKNLIKTSGKTAKEVAKDISNDVSYGTTISAATLSDLMNPDINKGFSYKYYIALARYFNVTTDYLLGLKEANMINCNICLHKPVCWAYADLKDFQVFNNCPNYIDGTKHYIDGEAVLKQAQQAVEETKNRRDFASFGEIEKVRNLVDGLVHYESLHLFKG